MSDEVGPITIEVAATAGGLAGPVTLRLPPGACVGDALRALGVEIPAECSLGIWGRLVTAQTQLSDGDRVEVCRPLAADPKAARRARAAAGRAGDSKVKA